jgi:hypothetical protein
MDIDQIESLHELFGVQFPSQGIKSKALLEFDGGAHH